MKRRMALCACILGAFAAGPAFGQAATTSASAISHNSSYIAPDGTAYVGRIVPVPPSLSPQAQAMLRRPASDAKVEMTLQQRRSTTDAYTARAEKQWQAICPVTITDAVLGGVPVRRVTPPDIPAANQNRVLLDLHGGGFDSDSGSFTESIPIAWYARVAVVAALYRLAPEHPFPAAVDDAVAVYRELLKTHRPDQIAIYGTSAGAILTAEVAVELKKLGLPEPAALGIFSGMGDFARVGDSIHLYSLTGLSGYLAPPSNRPELPPYVGKTDPKDPVLSPIYADLRNLPPSLFVTSGRDLLLSGTADLERAFQRAGDETQMMLFDGLPHAFWYNPDLPEAIEANQAMAKFLLTHLK